MSTSSRVQTVQAVLQHEAAEKSKHRFAVYTNPISASWSDYHNYLSLKKQRITHNQLTKSSVRHTFRSVIWKDERNTHRAYSDRGQGQRGGSSFRWKSISLPSDKKQVKRWKSRRVTALWGSRVTQCDTALSHSPRGSVCQRARLNSEVSGGPQLSDQDRRFHRFLSSVWLQSWWLWSRCGLFSLIRTVFVLSPASRRPLCPASASRSRLSLSPPMNDPLNIGRVYEQWEKSMPQMFPLKQHWFLNPL